MERKEEAMGIITLAELKPGRGGQVLEVGGTPEFRDRLEDLGLIPGLTLRCLHRAPGGSPAAYEIRGAAIALRRGDAAEILVEEAP